MTQWINLPANLGDAGSIPGWEGSLGGGKWQSTWVFLPGKSMGRGPVGLQSKGR